MNPTPSLNDNYLWIPEVSGNVVPGLDSLITSQSTYAILAALQHTITHIHNTTNNDINDIQTEINNIESANQRNVSN